MARIVVTIPPEMLSVSGFLSGRSFNLFQSFPSYFGNLVIGFDKRGIPIRIGKIPRKVTFNPDILVSEDIEGLVAEESIFYEEASINVSIKVDEGEGIIFPVDENNEPLSISPSDENNWPDSFLIEQRNIDVSKNSRIVLFDIGVPRRAKFSYSFIDVTTEGISVNNPSFYSLDSGETWIPSNFNKITIPEDCPGRILIYIDIYNISQTVFFENKQFRLACSIDEDLLFLTAEYGEDPDQSSEGELSNEDIIKAGRIITRQRGQLIDPIPYATFRRCLNSKGLAEYYGDSKITIINGQISYTYTYFESISNRCIK